MKLEDIIDKYNKQDFKNIGYEDIVMDLNSVASEEQKNEKYAFELLAFRLQPQHGENPWGNYHYGPQFTFCDTNGTPVYSPSFAEVSKEFAISKMTGICITLLLIQLWMFAMVIISNILF